MPAPVWHDRRSRVVAATDSEFAEQVRLTKKTLGRTLADAGAEGESYEFTAIVRLKSTSTDLGGNRRNWQAKISGDAGHVFVNRDQVPGGVVFNKHDVIKCLDMSGQPEFEVLDIDDRKVNRIKLRIGAKG